MDFCRAGSGSQRRGGASRLPGRRTGRPRGRDDVEPARVRGGRAGHQQAGRRPGAVELVLEGPRGGDGARPDRTSLRRGRRCRRGPAGRPAGRRRGPRPRRAPGRVRHRPDRHRRTTRCGGAGDRRRRLRVQLRHHRQPEGGAPHPRLHRVGYRALVPGARTDQRRPVPGRHAAVAHPRFAQPARRGGGRRHRRFDLDEELRCIEEERMTLEMAVAPIALAMANHPDLERCDLSSLRYVMWGATPVTPSVAETVTARSGVRWLPAYGTSEVPVITANPVDRPDAWRLDSAGLPVGDVELRVADLDSGGVLPAGETGETQVRSATAMAGYLPEAATAAAFADSEWYRTGDVGYLEPEGWVHLTDRRKEMIKVSGFQVAPAEIEAVLHGHPAVVDCAVFGVPDEQAGEVPVAAVQLAPGPTVGAGDLQRLVAAELATYKHLHRVVLVDSIPRTPSGKVLRRVLRDEWAPQLPLAVSG